MSAYCGAKKRQTEGTCRQAAGWGTDHPGIGRCKLHGGCTPDHRTNAARRATERDARAVLERLGEPEPLGDPIEELLGLGAEVREYQRILRERLSELGEWSSTDVALIDRERALVRLYGEALDRSARVLESLAKLGLDERLVRVREAQARPIVVALVKVLGTPALGLPPDRQQLARALIAAELGAMTGAGRVTERPTAQANAQVIEAKAAPLGRSSAGTTKRERP